MIWHETAATIFGCVSLPSSTGRVHQLEDIILDEVVAAICTPC